jgi:hypothetical protein
MLEFMVRAGSYGLRFVLRLQILSAHDGICYIRDFRLFLVIDTAMMGCRIEHPYESMAQDLHSRAHDMK